ncbi:segregation and condensation protein A [Eubacteriales bacterium KG127]
MSYKVKISSFEGPFDLLVYLIENSQMSIYNIKISQITSQYMEYMEDLSGLDVEKATEFMVLAASLLEIKSRMILPIESDDEEGIVEEDPRSQLVERILEYKNFKVKAKSLEERWEDNQRILTKPQEDITRYTDSPDEYLSLGIEDFIRVFNDFLAKKQKIDQVRKQYTRIEREKASMESRIKYILECFRTEHNAGRRKFFLRELVPGVMDNYNLVVTFTAALQMINHKQIVAEQSALYGDIALSLSEETEADE